MLEIKDLQRKVGKFHLEHIDFQVEEGYLVGILGPNGAGKTTFFKALMEPKKGDKGSILWMGKDIRKNHVEFLGDTAYITEDMMFIEKLTAMETAQMLGVFYEHYTDEAFEACMEKVGVSKNITIAGMSRGQKIRFQLAFGMARKAKLYLMDEPTAGMDPAFRKEFYDLLRELLAKGVTVLMSTHVQSDINRNMDYVLTLKEGKQLRFQENFGEAEEWSEVEICVEKD